MMYTVTATRGRDPRVWVLQCDQVPGAISQTRRLSDAPDLMREAIAFVADVDPATVEVEVRPALGESLEGMVRTARTAVAKLTEEQTRVARISRQAAVRLRQAGLTGRDISSVLHISPQRVSQLLATNEQRDDAASDGSRHSPAKVMASASGAGASRRSRRGR